MEISIDIGIVARNTETRVFIQNFNNIWYHVTLFSVYLLQNENSNWI